MMVFLWWTAFWFVVLAVIAMLAIVQHLSVHQREKEHLQSEIDSCRKELERI